MSRHHATALAVMAFLAAGAGAAHAAPSAEAIKAEQDCSAQYRAANPTGRTTAGQQASVNQCMQTWSRSHTTARAHRPSTAAVQQESRCGAQYVAANANGRTTAARQAYVTQCMQAWDKTAAGKPG